MDIASLGVNVTTSGAREAAADLDKLAASGEKAAASTDKLTRANADAAKRYNSPQYRQQANDLAKLIGQIDPTVAALDRLDKQQAKLAAFKKSGMLSADDFKTYSNAIDEARAGIVKASEATHSFTLNNANARRELGYMAKDIATGQWGRLSQSFGTLASNTGLLGAAFSATGATIAAIAAPLAVFAAAAIKGYTETENLRTSLIATGGAAGVSTRALSDMASAVGEATGSWGDARKAIELFTASGKVAGAGISGLAKEAVEMAQVTGESVDKTVAKILELGDRPSETISKLNEQYHLLTSAQYAQIAALEEEGRVQDAARLAQAAVGDEMARRARQIEDNAGWIVRSAHWVRDEWNKAWDATKGIGRAPSLADKATDLQAQIDALSKVRVDRQGNLVQGANGEQIAKLKQQLDEVHRQQVQQAFADSEKSLQDAMNQDAIAAQRRLADFATPKERLDSTLAKANRDRLAALYGVVDPDQRAKIEAQYSEQVKAAKDAYANATKDRGAGFWSTSITEDPRASLTASITKEIDGFKKEEDQWARSTTAAYAYRQSLQDMLATRQRAIDLQVASIGMGQREVAEQQAIIAIDEDYNRKKADLQKRQQNATSELDREGYQAQLDALEQYHTDRIRMEMDGWRAIDRARASFANGLQGALANIQDEGRDVAGQTKAAFTNAFDSLTDSLGNFVATGKLDFGSLADSMIADLAKIELRILASQVLTSIFGQDTTGTTAIANEGINAQIARNDAGMTFKPHALGGVYNSPSLSAYSGGVYDKPTLFAFAKGAGVFGEAGPEAIMPLRRGPDGKLGVSASRSTGDAPQVEINITNNGQAVQAQQTGQRMDGNKMIVDLVLTTVANDIATGGKVAKAGQQRFGWTRRGVPVSGG